MVESSSSREAAGQAVGSVRKPASPAGRYLLYAIGEIALVVIGILIALSINNWNEDKKDRITQLRLLKELRTTAQEDLNRNQRMVRWNGMSLASIDVLLKHLQMKGPYHDSLLTHFTMAHNRIISQIKDNSYENLKAFGLDFIKNDTTKRMITHSYENRFQILETMDERFDQFYYHVAAPVLVSVFESMNPQGVRDVQMVPLDYNSLLHNQEYLTILKSTRAHLKQYLEWQKNAVLGDLERILKRLDIEIDLY